MILGSHDHPQGWLGFFVEQFESFWTPPKNLSVALRLLVNHRVHFRRETKHLGGNCTFLYGMRIISSFLNQTKRFITC